jgi:serine/threonine-protein kinase
MAANAPDSGSREERVNAILAVYLDAAAAGAVPDRAELLARHPDLATELAAFFAEDAQVRRLAEPPSAAPPLPGTEPTTIGLPETPRSPQGHAAMQRDRTCQQGHHWPADGDAAGSCPICGATASLPSEQQTLAPAPAPPGVPTEPLPSAMHTASFTPTDPMRGAPSTPAVERLAPPGYEILDELGRGGMGVVYRARQTKLNRIVALKMILAGGHADAAHRDRFQAEAQAIARLQHPNIVQIHEVGEHDGLPYFSLEFCPGGSLAQKLAGTPLPPKQAAGMVETISRAMHAAHLKGILHRDLKPANVLLAPLPIEGEGLTRGLGTPKVTDFGLAKQLDEAAHTASGAVVGTPSYMAPEQAAGKSKELGPACDIYALGAVLYECLTGRPPFRAATPLDTIMQVISDEPVPPRRLNPQVPRDLETICLKCLHKQPARRFATAQALAEDLRRFAAGEPITARPVGRGERVLKWVRRNPGAAATAAALLVSVAALTAGLFWYQHEQNRLAAEESRRDAEAALRRAERERQRELAEVAIAHALDQADQQHHDLHAALRKPGGVFGLLNDPARWQAQIQAATAAVERARALLANAEEGLDPRLSMRVASMQQLLARDEAERRLAVRLEEIRTDMVIWAASRFDYAKAAEEYPKAFAGAGFAPLAEQANAVAEQFRTSPIREMLVAGLDTWAAVTYVLVKEGVAGKERLLEQLLALGRQVSPDPDWGDRLRQVQVWRDPQASAALAQDAPRARLSPPMLSFVGHLIRYNPPLQEAWLREAQEQYPADFWLNLDLGVCLHRSNPLEAAGFCRVAIAVRPGSSAAHCNLAAALAGLGRYPEAIASCRKAIELNPKHVFAYHNLGTALLDQQQLPAAIDAFKQAITLDPAYANAYNGLGNALLRQESYPEAIAAYEKAIALDPTFTAAYYNLGMARIRQQRLPEAIAAFRKVVEINPQDGEAHQQLKQCQDILALEKRVAAVRSRTVVAEPSELLQLAQQCQRFMQRHVSAVELYQRAFKANPSLADDGTNRHRYSAAVSAAQVGAGHGAEAGKLPEERKSELRHQARAWLQADLDRHVRQLKTGKPAAITLVEQELSRWQTDAELGYVRDAKELAKLPGTERPAWQSLWADVSDVLKDARGRFTENRVEGTLTAKDRSKVHTYKMSAGRLYVVDLESTVFDALLKLEDAQGKLLAENDDIEPGVNLNARLEFTPRSDGAYRLVATSFEQAGAGPYTLRIREFKRVD